MSTSISAAVWKNSKAKATGLLVLLSLADQANDEGWCWPSVETIASRCRISTRTVQRFLFELERLEEVEREERPGTSTRYRILVRGDNLSPRQSVSGDTGVRGGVTTVSPRNVSETSIDNSSLRSELSRAPEKTKRATRLPADWKPPNDVIEQLRGERPDLDLRREHENFTDYWIAKPGKDGTKLDWVATWRRWMRNARPANGANGNRYALKRQEETDQHFANMLARARQIDADRANQPKEISS